MSDDWVRFAYGENIILTRVLYHTPKNDKFEEYFSSPS